MEEFVEKFKGLYQSSAENNSYFDSGFFKKVEQLHPLIIQINPQSLCWTNQFNHENWLRL
jgi:hypothetical protein